MKKKIKGIKIGIYTRLEEVMQGRLNLKGRLKSRPELDKWYVCNEGYIWRCVAHTEWQTFMIGQQGCSLLWMFACSADWSFFGDWHLACEMPKVLGSTKLKSAILQSPEWKDVVRQVWDYTRGYSPLPKLGRCIYLGNGVLRKPIPEDFPNDK